MCAGICTAHVCVMLTALTSSTQSLEQAHMYSLYGADVPQVGIVTLKTQREVGETCGLMRHIWMHTWKSMPGTLSDKAAVLNAGQQVVPRMYLPH
jgi:hypothetical protein